MTHRILLVAALLSVTACNEDGGGNAPMTPAPAFSIRDADGMIATAIPVTPEFPDPLTADTRLIVSDGHIMFSSDAPLIGTTDTNGAADVFLYVPYATAGENFRLASNTSGTDINGSQVAGNAASGNVPAWPTPNSISLSGISGNNQCLAFVSDATNLAGGSDNALTDVFLATFGSSLSVIRVSESPLLHIGFSESSHSPSASDCAVAFVTAAAADSLNDGNGVEDVYMRQYGSLELISKSTSGQAGNGASFSPIAINGYVYFLSWASNLVPDDTNGSLDLFRRDTYYDTTTRVSIGNNETEADLGLAGPADYGKTVFPAVPYDVSAHGRYVAFLSPATNLVADDSNGTLDAFLRDNERNTTVRASANELSGVSGATEEGIALGSAYGSHNGHTEFYPGVAFVSDQLLTGAQSPVGGGPRDVYYREYRSNTLRRLSHPGSGNLLYAIRPQMADAGYVYFTGAVETETPGTYVELFLRNAPTY